MLEKLKEEVYQGNMDLIKHGLVLFTWGNVSAIDREKNLVVIKPSGVDYATMKPSDMVVIDLDGNIVEGSYKPSSDTMTHLELYKNYENINSVVHTHSKWACIWAQACKSIPNLGTTHSDNFYGAIPVTRALTDDEINNEYELNTGKVIVETFKVNDITPEEIGAVVVAHHGPFSFAKTVRKAVENSAVMEYVAEMAYYTLDINEVVKMSKVIEDKHYLRKHGVNAYYGQSK